MDPDLSPDAKAQLREATGMDVIPAEIAAKMGFGCVEVDLTEETED